MSCHIKIKWRLQENRRRSNFYCQEKLVSLFLELAERIKVRLSCATHRSGEDAAVKFTPTFQGLVRQEDIIIGKYHEDESAYDEKDGDVQQEVILAK